MTTVTITRPRHPLRGQPLRVLGQMRRHGRLELLAVLPDGSKTLIPAAWTDLADNDNPAVHGQAEQATTATLGTLADLGHTSALVRALSTRTGETQEQAARHHLPRRTTVQPTQLSLLPDPTPTPPPTMLDQLPVPQTTAVISLLAGLIAKAAAPTQTEAGDE